MAFFKVNKSFPILNGDQINNQKKYRENDTLQGKNELIKEFYVTEENII